jgi:hypothetical protein
VTFTWRSTKSDGTGIPRGCESTLFIPRFDACAQARWSCSQPFSFNAEANLSFPRIAPDSSQMTPKGVDGPRTSCQSRWKRKSLQICDAFGILVKFGPRRPETPEVLAHPPPARFHRSNNSCSLVMPVARLLDDTMERKQSNHTFNIPSTQFPGL